MLFFVFALFLNVGFALEPEIDIGEQSFEKEEIFEAVNFQSNVSMDLEFHEKSFEDFERQSSEITYYINKNSGVVKFSNFETTKKIKFEINTTKNKDFTNLQNLFVKYSFNSFRKFS